MRHAVGGGGAFEEDEGRAAFPLLEGPFVDPFLFPEGEDGLLLFWEGDISADRAKHKFLKSLIDIDAIGHIAIEVVEIIVVIRF